MTEHGESLDGAVGPEVAGAVGQRAPRQAACFPESVARELHDLVLLLRRRFLDAGPVEPHGPDCEALAQALTRTAAAAERLLALGLGAERSEPRPPPGGRPRPIVLVAERDPTLRRLHRAILERNGCQALLAESGGQALEVYRFMVGQVHTVVLDSALPQWPPARLIRELRAVCPNVRILLTSASDPVVEAAELPFPVAGLLAKPFRAEQLLMLIQGPVPGQPGGTETAR
jgi:CheY-like chemotaxis protein